MLGVAEWLKAPECGSGFRGFESRRSTQQHIGRSFSGKDGSLQSYLRGFESLPACQTIADAARLAERLVPNQEVAGSRPVIRSKRPHLGMRRTGYEPIQAGSTPAGATIYNAVVVFNGCTHRCQR
jgi:hypothetical protein